MELNRGHKQGEKGPPQAGERPAELPNGSSVSRAPNGAGTQQSCGKASLPSPPP